MNRFSTGLLATFCHPNSGFGTNFAVPDRPILGFADSFVSESSPLASNYFGIIKLSDFLAGSSENRCYTQPKYWFPADFYPAGLFSPLKKSCSGSDYRPARKDVQTAW